MKFQAGTAGGGPSLINRIEKQGKDWVMQWQTRVDRSEYLNDKESSFRIPVMTRGRWMFTGYSSEPFEMANYEGTGMDTKMRGEFLCIESDRAELVGRRISLIFTLTKGPTSGFAGMIGTVRGRPLDWGEEYDPADYLGYNFEAYTRGKQNAPREFGSLDFKAVDPDTVQKPPFQIVGIEDEPEPLGVDEDGVIDDDLDLAIPGVPATSGNPFLMDL